MSHLSRMPFDPISDPVVNITSCKGMWREVEHHRMGTKDR